MEIPGFEQCEKIAESGFASYWQAFQRSLNRHVTLVLLRPDAVSDPQSRHAFLRDIRIVAGLKHPALFQVYDVMEMDATLVVCVEHLTGLTMRHYVRQRGVIKGAKALTIVRWVAEGLSHVYDKTGLVHRALTPDQIWINAEGQVKILGFGFSDIFERIGYSHEDVPFLSPEQVQHRSCDFYTDLYAVGALLYYMVTGRVPFEGNSSQETLNLIGTGQLPAPSLAVNGGTVALNQLMARLMMKDPQNRYPGWLPAMQEMDKVLDGAKFLTSAKKGGGLSTILLSAPNRARPTTSPETAPAAAATATVKQPVSKSSQAATLLILGLVVGFWVWVGITLWRMPPPVPVSAKGAAAGPAIPMVEGKGEIQEDERPSARVRVVRQPSANPAGAIDTTPPPVSPEEAPPLPPATDPFDDLTDRVLRHLTAGERELAMLAVDNAARSPDRFGGAIKLEELKRLLTRGGDPEGLVLEQLQRQVGGKISLQINGRMTPLTIDRIEGRNVIMTQDTLSGSVSVQRHVTMPVGTFALGDQVRLMGDGTGPEFALARILVYLKGGAKERAAGLVSQAGPLGPAIGRLLEAAP